MARSVSLSDEAFATLRRDKRAGESDSDVVLRLHDAAHRKAKDPLSFARNPPTLDWSQEDFAKFDEAMSEADRHKVRGLWP